MKIKIERIKKNEKPFVLAWIIYLVVKILKTSFYARFFPEHDTMLLIACCLPLLFIHELQNIKSSYKELVGIAICILFVLITLRLRFMGGGGSDIALMFIFIYCARKVSLHSIFKLTIIVTAFMTAFIIGSSFLGIIKNYVDYGTRIRQYLGFRYMLYGPALLFNITLLYLYVKQISITWKGIMFLFFANTLLYLWTDSRLSFGLSILAIIFAVLAKHYWDYLNKRHWWYWIVVFSFLICAVVSLVLTVMYTPEKTWLYQLNKLFGGRLFLGQTSLIRYGVNLWGQNIEWVGNGLDAYGNRLEETYLYVDCLYIQILQHYGIVFTGLFIVLVTIAMFICYQQARYYLLFMFAFVAAHCMCDDLSWYLYYNTFWLAIGMLLMRKKKSIVQKE